MKGLAAGGVVVFAVLVWASVWGWQHDPRWNWRRWVEQARRDTREAVIDSVLAIWPEPDSPGVLTAKLLDRFGVRYVFATEKLGVVHVSAFRDSIVPRVPHDYDTLAVDAARLTTRQLALDYDPPFADSGYAGMDSLDAMPSHRRAMAAWRRTVRAGMPR